MNDLERVNGWFADGTLVRPDRGSGTLIDLIRALSAICGGQRFDLSANARRIVERIGVCDHVIFVLIDGLGMRLLEDLKNAASGFLRKSVIQELQTVFPSTTAVALTSLCTAQSPAVHGIPGWWIYLAEVDASAETLPFVERFSKRSLADFGVKSDSVFTTPSILGGFARDHLVVTRTYICDSTYSRYWSGGSPSLGYQRISDGVDAVIGRVLSAQVPTYTHLYLNQLDSLCHELGIEHPKVRELFLVLDREMERLAKAVGKHACLVISADHGHIDAGPADAIAHHDGLMALLRCPPSGEARIPLFHVRPGQGDRFSDEFRKRHGEHWALLSMDEVESLRLLGDEPLAPIARRHFGDFMALAAEDCTMRYLAPEKNPHPNIGVHAGLSAPEMMVPLILARD